ncbi:beta strand repeat-containing protein [Rhodopirellula sp. MGV]|uniref:beta strand repeat-containing protein n=1 Tax=Rhodopirellula sp. MGV TaxID=2023130 RepID=UPI000BD5DE4F|nr:hypothetical protein [Rhodopirellula sp. MGV]OYP35811.1 hypothetical protein CGZ80_10450 [Rhodopirellula sp. MGV]
MQLETRRVLNADGVLSELVIDAGQDADDGHADVYQIDVHESTIDVRVNGQSRETRSIDDIAKIRIVGSGDSDHVQINYHDAIGRLIDFEIDGHGGADQVSLAGEQQFDELIAAISGRNAFDATLRHDGTTSEMVIRNVEQIEQALDVAEILVSLQADDLEVNLQIAERLGDSNILTFGASLDAGSQSTDQLRYQFDSPSAAFSLDTVDQQGSGNEVFLHGGEGWGQADFRILGDASDTVHGDGVFRFSGDNFDVASGKIVWAGSLQTDRASIAFHASQSLTLVESSHLSGVGSSLDLVGARVLHEGQLHFEGGVVSIDSLDSGTTIIRGTIDVSDQSVGGIGGQIRVTGQAVGLFDNATLLASGHSGGGQILIGGDYQGQGETIANAERTFVATNVAIRADAIHQGQGGKVIVWANDWTRYYGQISARGGQISGDGGFVEVSGREALAFYGGVDVASPSGQMGRLLLDPMTVTIVNAGSDDAELSDSEILSGDSSSSNFDISASAISDVAGLVTIQASRDIFVNEAISLSNASLAFQAGRHIDVNANITVGGDLYLEADSVHVASNGTGDLTIAAGVTIAAPNGEINLLAAGFSFDATAVVGSGATNINLATSSGDSLTVGSDIDVTSLGTIATTGTLTLGQATTAGDNRLAVNRQTTVVSSLVIDSAWSVVASNAGTLSLVGNNGITFDASLTSNQAITMNADADVDGVGTVEISSTQAVNSTDHLVSITAADLDFQGDLIAGTAAVSINESFAAGILVGGNSGSGQMVLGASELGRIAATGLTLQTGGAITVAAIASTDSDQILGVVTLSSGTSTTFNSQSSFNALDVRAVDGIAINANVSTQVGDLDLDADFDNATSGTLQIADGIQLDSAGALSLYATTGGISAAGDWTLNANSGVTLGDAVSSSGALTIDADFDDDGIGTATISDTLSTSDQSVEITANDLVIVGAVGLGAGDLMVRGSTGTSIGLGSATVAGGMQISDAELGLITADDFIVQSDSSIQVAGVSSLTNLSGSARLLANGATSTVVFGASASSFETLVVDANDGITFNGNVTTTIGSMTLRSDNDGDEIGTVTVVAGAAVTSATEIQITAEDIDLQGTVSSTGATSIDDAGGITSGIAIGSASIAGGLNLSGAELQAISASALTLSTGGDLDIGLITAAQSNGVSGTLTLNSDGRVTVESAGAVFNSLAINANAGVAIDGNLSTDTGDLTIDGDTDLIDDGAGVDAILIADGVQISSTGILTLDADGDAITGAGSVQLVAADGISINDSLTTSGDLTINADSDAGDQVGEFTLAASASITTSNNTLNLTANDVVLSGTINTGTGSLLLVDSDGSGVALGTATVLNGLNLTGAELQAISTAFLRLTSTGGIESSQVTAANTATISSAQMVAGGSVTFSGETSFQTLDVRADGGVAVSADVTTSSGDLLIDGDFDDVGGHQISFADGIQLSSAGLIQLSATSGGMVGSGDLTFHAASGVTIESSLTVTGTLQIDADSDTLLTAGALTVDASAIVSSSGTMTIRADELFVNGSLSSGSAAMVINESEGNGIGLGDTASGGVDISNSELSRFTASELQLNTDGSITVDNVSQPASISGSVSLDAGAEIQFINTATTFRTLLASADDRITVDVDLTTTVGSLTLIADADLAADVNDDIQIAAGVTLTSAGAISLAADTGAIFAAGDLDLLADDGVTVTDSLTAIGALTIDADRDANDDLGTFAVGSGAVVTSTTSHMIQITANDLDLAGTLGDASTTLTITDSDDDGIGLGDAVSSGINFSGAELASLIVNHLTLTTGGAILVENVAAADSNSIGGLLTLNSGGSVSFSGDSVFNAIDVRADDGVLIHGDLTTDLGQIRIDGDANTSADSVDQIRIADGVQIQSATNLHLLSTTGGLVGLGGVDLLATNGIVLEDAFSGAGTLTIDADSDDNGSGTIQALSSIATSNSAIDITAADLDFQSTVSAGSGALTLRDSSGVGFSVGANLLPGTIGLGNTELAQFTAGDLTLRTSGDIVADQVSVPATITGTVTLTADGANSTVTFQNGASSFVGLAINASDGVVLNASVSTTQVIAINADTDAGDGIGTFTIGVLGGLNSTGQDIAITADSIELQGNLDAGAGDVLLVDSDGSGIGLGDTSVGFDVSGSELQLTVANNLELRTSGAMVVDRITAANSNGIAGLLTLNAGGSITFTNNGAIFNSLQASGNGISIAGLLSTDVGDLTIDGDANNSGGDSLTFAAGASVQSAGTLTIAATTGGINSTGALTLIAADGINIEDDLTTLGALVLNADSDVDLDAGTLHVAAGAAIVTNNSALTIIAADLDIQGSFNSGTASTTIQNSDGDDIGLGSTSLVGGMNLSTSDLQDFTTNGLNIITAGDVIVQDFTQSGTVGGTTTITATNVSFLGTASSFRTLVVNADDQISVSSDLSTADGDLALVADADSITDTNDNLVFADGVVVTSSGLLTLQADGGGIVGQGTLTLIGDDGVTIKDSLSTLGVLTIDADRDNSGLGTLTVEAGVTVDSNNQAINLTVGEMTIAGAVNSGTATISIEDSDGGGIGLGQATVVGGLNLAVSDFQNMTAGGLVLTTTGNIVVDSMSQPATLGGTTELNAIGNSSTIQFTGGASSFNEVAVNASDGVQVQASLTATIGTLSIDADVDGSDDIGTLTVDAGVVLSTNNQVVTLVADDIDLQGTVNSGTAGTVIEVSDNDVLGLGSVVLADGLTFDSTEMSRISSGDLTFRAPSRIQVEAFSQPATVQGTTYLESGGDVQFINQSSSFGTLSVSADDQIVINVDLTTTEGAMSLDGDADSASGTANSILIADGVTLAAATSLTLASQTGGVTVSGAAQFSSDDSILINTDVIANGVLSIDADADQANGGTLTVASTGSITSNNQLIQIVADDIVVDGTIDSGTANLSLTDSDGTGIGLGLAAVTGGMNLSSAESNNLTAGDLILNTSGNLTVDSFTQGGNISGFFDLQVTGNGSRVTFSGGDSTFNRLNVSSTDGVVISSNLSSLLGDLSFNADSDPGDGQGTFTVSSTGAIDSNDHNIVITANNATVQGTIDAGTGSITFVDSDGSGVRLGSGGIPGMLILGQAEVNRLITSELVVQSSNRIEVAGLIQNASTADTTRLVSGRYVQFLTAESSFNQLRVDADDGVYFDANVTTTVGDLYLDSDANGIADGNDSVNIADGIQIASAGDLEFSTTSGKVTAFGSASLLAGNDLILQQVVTAQGTLTLHADSDADSNGTVQITSAASVTTNNNALNLIGNDLDLQGTVSSGTAITTIEDSNGDGIGVGAAVIAGGMHVSNTELGSITAGGLTINSSGDIEVNGAVQPVSITGGLNLNAGQTISFLNTSPVWESISASADNGLNVNVDLTTTGGSLVLDSDADDSGVGTLNIAFGVQLTSSDQIRLDGALIQGNGGLVIRAADGVQIVGDFQTGGTLTVNADTDSGDNSGTFTISATGSLTSSNQSLTITANDVNLLGAINIGTGTLHVNDSDGSGIGLGNAVVANGLNLSGSELEKIQAGALDLATSGSIYVSGVAASDTALIVGLTTLDSDGQISFSGSGSSFDSLDVQAANGILINSDLITTGGDLSLDADTNNTVDGVDAVLFAAGVTVQSAGSLSMSADQGGLVGSGALTLQAADGITINQSLTTAGALIIDADTDAGDGNGLLTIATGMAIDTNGNELQITADDISFGGTINVGTASVTITESEGTGIGLGTGVVVGGMNLSQSEWDAIQAGNLSLISTGGFVVSGINQSSNLSGTISLSDNGGTADVAFQSTASTFRDLSVNVGGDISVDTSVESVLGNLVFVSGGSFTTSSSGQVLGIGGRTLVSVTAASATIASGSSGDESLRNRDEGVVVLTTTSGDIDLGDHAVGSDLGAIAISSAANINETSNNQTANITTAGSVFLSAVGAIGATAGADLSGNGALDVSSSYLTAHSSGVGGVFVRVGRAVNLGGASAASGSVEVLSADAMNVLGAVSAGGSGDVVLQALSMIIVDDGDISSAAGTIDITATTAGGLLVTDGAVFSTNQGSFSGKLVNASDPFAGSTDIGDALTDSNRIAQIDFVIVDPYATGIDVQINWQEGDPLGPQTSSPPGDPRTQIIQSTISPAYGSSVFAHNYENAPDPSNPSADINVEIGIVEIANGTINLTSGGTSVFDDARYDSQTIVLAVSSPILPFFVSLPGESRPSAIVQPAANVTRVLERQRTFVTQTALVLTNSIGTAQQSDHRYYVLRLVTFGSEGEVKIIKENQEYRLPDLENPESETGFEISQLPELFKRLPDDRYRVYMIEGQTERLVLDFVIRDGQPIESQQLDAAESQPGLGSSGIETSGETEMTDDEKDTDAEKETTTAIERLGKSPFVVAGGMILSSHMLSHKRRQTNRSVASHPLRRIGSTLTNARQAQ